MPSTSGSFKEKLAGLKLAVKWTYQSSKFLTISILIITILGGLITIVEPYLFKLIIDYLLGQNDLSVKLSLSIGIIGILIIYAVARIFQNIFWDINNMIRRVHSLRIEKQAMHSLMENISSLDLVYFEDPDYYNTLSRATSGLWRILEVFWQFTFMIGEIVSVVVIVGALFAFDWRLVGLVILGAVPSVLLVLRTAEVQWSAFAQSSPIFRHADYYRSLLTENPQAIKEVKSFRLREHFLKKFRDLFNDFIKNQDKAALTQLKWYVLVGVVEGTLSVFASWLVVKSFLAGGITIGDLTFLWALLFQFAAHVRWIVRMLGDMNTHAAFLTPVVKVLNFKPKITEPVKGHKFPKKLTQGIEFRNVSFVYHGSKKLALKNINLKFKPKESIALVGGNGSGKTTLIKLLCRLYDCTDGKILIDGVNIKDYSVKSLNDNLGVIFQDFMKYEALVEENISYGRISAKKSKFKLLEAAKKSGAWDFIKDLEKKLKTQLGKKIKEDGTELSGGQWQKIALARAFFKNAPILILDEPTAAVDARAEYHLFRRFKQLSRNKMTFLISHRFSTVRMADRIIVMAKGRVVEQGSHSELLDQNGIYAKLFKLQAKGYK
ncbi:MAG TPA: ABC transporter ATP-binding protein [Candidatus Nanoarchaeia archaeon]|nr:ABC transporter ATP-binding protein [Candidatus Nanoarchaeia archaeon]